MNMFLGITINNIRVSLMAFVLGIFLGIGTLFLIMRNAIMLGAFQYFFYDKGVLWESVRTIWIHGTIEISVIIIDSYKKGLRFRRGSNSRPSACKADVITTTLRNQLINLLSLEAI